MNEAQSLGLIMRKFRSLKQPTSTKNIESSEAYSYLYEEIISEGNRGIYTSIFGILVANLQKFDFDHYYFNFTEKIMEYHDYNKDMISNQIEVLSLNEIDNSIKKEKFYFYISLLNPILIYGILVKKDYSDLQLFLIMNNSILKSGEKVLISVYLEYLCLIMKSFDGDNSKELNFIVGNYSYVLRDFSKSAACLPGDASYLIGLADFYEQRLE